MDALRRNILKNAGGVGMIGLAIGAGLLKPTLALADWNKAAFDAKTVPEAIKALGAASAAESKEIIIKAPDIAENGVVVPVEITSNIAGTTSISILAEKNATPLVADFDFSGGASQAILFFPFGFLHCRLHKLFPFFPCLLTDPRDQVQAPPLCG